jgi:hypothetical protein
MKPQAVHSGIYIWNILPLALGWIVTSTGYHTILKMSTENKAAVEIQLELGMKQLSA